jgi:hypothetical protein
MSRILTLTVTMLTLIAAGLATASQAGAADEGQVYQRYADIRERLGACHLEGENGWNDQTSAGKAACRRLARRYVLYSTGGEGFTLNLHCRSPLRCIGTPPGEPRADGPIPAGARVYDIKVPRASAGRKKKRHRRSAKARSRRSQAAHGSAAASR